MPIRQRTTKLLARRHDLGYFKRLSRIRAWQWWLACVAVVVSVLWIGSSTLLHGSTAFSAGPMSSSHAAIGTRCELCHVPVIAATGFMPSLGLRRRVPDSACISCHANAPHHPEQATQTASCASCHTEHIGAMHLAATADSGCTQCHARLTSRSGVLHVVANITNFGTDHPDFRELRTATMEQRSSAFALRFNHAEHMQPGLRSPDGSSRNLSCSSCHVAGMNADGKHSTNFRNVSFAGNCRTCHTLDFDSHLQVEAPHAAPAQVRAFVRESLTSYARDNTQNVAAEIRNWPSEAPLPGRVVLPAPRSVTEWIDNRTMHAEVILWRQKCALCHRDTNPETPLSFYNGSLTPISLPQIETTHQPEHWFSDAVFSHPAHQAVACTECHAKALTSSSGSDVLMPFIATCRQCHDGQSSPQGPPVKAGHAESGCVLCHVYHGPETASATLAGRSLSDLR